MFDPFSCCKHTECVNAAWVACAHVTPAPGAAAEAGASCATPNLSPRAEKKNRHIRFIYFDTTTNQTNNKKENELIVLQYKIYSYFNTNSKFESKSNDV